MSVEAGFCIGHEPRDCFQDNAEHAGGVCLVRGGRAGRVGAAGRGRFPALQQHARAGSASPSATRTPTAGPPKAGGTCRHEPARPCSKAISSPVIIMSTPSITIAAANGRDGPICAPATRNSRSAASAIAWPMATTAPASSKSTPASSAPGPCSSPNPPSSRRKSRCRRAISSTRPPCRAARRQRPPHREHRNYQ